MALYARWKNKYFQCAIGKNGYIVEENKMEGDGKTPLGLFRLEEVWYRKDRISDLATSLPTKHITTHDGWCDDPQHPFYNQHISLPFSGSHEVLWREDYIYDMILVMNHNRQPVIPYKGSAVFIHVARCNDEGSFLPTAGCLGFHREDLQELLREFTRNTYVNSTQHQDFSRILIEFLHQTI
jgi:L,D-peptidoglycan transpeptidase YkuD (ErfK/YbiS/YcfS/YnhG family)